MADRLSAAELSEILDVRRSVRAAEGGGGQCAFVAEELLDRFGWEIEAGVYLASDGSPIGHHVWNRLPEGAILDATADQFCEGYDVRVVEPTDPEFGRFRWEWTDFCHPGHSEYPELAGIAWTGEYDFDRYTRSWQERGSGWWLPDPASFLDWETAEDGIPTP